MTLAQAVLDKLAKEFKIEKNPERQDWREIPKNYCFSKKRVERAVKLALEMAQVEVLKEIEFVENNSDFDENTLEILKKCLLAKPAPEKKEKTI